MFLTYINLSPILDGKYRSSNSFFYVFPFADNIIDLVSLEQQENQQPILYIQSTSSEDVKEYEEQLSPEVFQPARGKSWESSRQAAVTNFYAACSTDAQAQQLQLRQVHVAQALEEHASAFFGDKASVGRALQQAAPDVPPYAIPLQWTLQNQQLQRRHYVGISWGVYSEAAGVLSCTAPATRTASQAPR